MVENEKYHATKLGKANSKSSQTEIFDQHVNAVISCLNEHANDLQMLQSQIILLIKDYIKGEGQGNSLSKLDEDDLNKDVTRASKLLIKEHNRTAKADDNEDLNNPGKNHYSLSNQSKENLKRLIKGFAIYEVYKVMNPKRIAGETKKENFAHNVITRGFEEATHYTGGSKEELKNYSPDSIKKLQNRPLFQNNKKHSFHI